MAHHVDMKENFSERDEEVKEEPVVHHLHVARLRQLVAHAHKHRCQHQHHLQGDLILNLANIEMNGLNVSKLLAVRLTEMVASKYISLK